MRTNLLFLVGALGILQAATSIAQVVSANAVGFVNISVPANGLAIVAVPLNGTNNQLNTTMPLPPGSDGCVIFRYSCPLVAYQDAINWFDGFGWFSPADPSPTVDPGESFWFQNVTAGPIPLTFIGAVPQGDLQNPVPGGNCLRMVSSQVPWALSLGEPGVPDTLNFPASDGDTVFVFDLVTQTYKDPYNYFTGFGWFSANPDDPGPRGPVIPVATGFWTQRPGADAIWRQSFSVNQ